MTVYLSLGANLGQRKQTIQRAIDLLAEQVGKVISQSSFFYSEPWGFESQHPFCNCCVALQTDLSPIDLLHATQAIERELGRTKKTPLTDPLAEHQYSDRNIDIDLIRAFQNTGEEILISSPELSLPHPLWQQRDFVTIPLAEIVPAQ